jgi:hypothetical protein
MVQSAKHLVDADVPMGDECVSEKAEVLQKFWKEKSKAYFE